MGDLASVVEQALREVASCGALAALEDCRVKWLGKKGGLTEQLKALGALPAGERPAALYKYPPPLSCESRPR